MLTPEQLWHIGRLHRDKWVTAVWISWTMAGVMARRGASRGYHVSSGDKSKESVLRKAMKRGGEVSNIEVKNAP